MGAVAAPMYAPGAAPFAPGAPGWVLTAATPDPGTPSPDPWMNNVSLPLGAHPASVGQRNTMNNVNTANYRADHVVDFAKDVDLRLRKGTEEHLKRIQPFNVSGERNWTEFWPHQRPFDTVWVVPPMQRDIISWTNRNLAHAVMNVSQEVPHMVHEAIMRHTREMVQRMREKPLEPTRPPPATTTWAPPDAIAPPDAPGAAPAVAIPAAPEAPAGAPEGAGAPTADSYGYMLGPDGEYYKIPLCAGGACDWETTTMGPTTPVFTTTPSMVKGANGRMYIAPKTPAMVMGPDGRYYSAR